MHPLLNLFTKLKKTSVLNATRKSLMRDMILTEIAQKEGVRVDELLRLHRQGESKRSFFRNINVVFNRMPITIIMSIVVLVGGGTSFAAERAKPGDVLYPVKIHVNEEVRAAVSFSAEGKTLWETHRAERRLEEAAALMEENAINAETRAELETRFKAHARRIEDRIEKMEESGKREDAEEIAARFESSLKAHEAILISLRGKVSVTEETRTEVRPVLEHVSTTLKGIANVRENLEARISQEHGPNVQVAAEARLKVAENILAEAKEFIEKKSERMTREARAEADIRIREADRTLAAARTKFEAKAYAEAFSLASKAIRLSHEAKSYTETSIRVEVNLKSTDRSRETATATPSPTSSPSSTPSPLLEIRGEGSLETELNRKDRNETEIKSNGSIKLNIGR